MNLSRYFLGAKTEEAREVSENPFRWAEGIENPAPSGGVEQVESVFEASGVDDLTDNRGEGADPVTCDKQLKSDRAWFSRFGSREPSTGGQGSMQLLEEVVVKRNDLWESDWEVRVSDSGTAGIESEKPQLRRSQGFGQWIRSVLGFSAQSESRKAVDL